MQEDDTVVEESVTVQYMEPVQVSPDTVSTPEELSNVSTPDNLSESDGAPADMRMRISYEEAISNASHEGESLIARELREAREREEELQRQRERLAGSTTRTEPKKESTPVKEVEVSKHSDNQKPSYQKDVGPYKHARKQSTDSLSSGHSNEKPQTVTPKNVRITTFGGGVMSGLTYKAPEKPKDTKRQETPIEREIRLARERENELRVSKGLPPLEDVKKVDYDSDQEKDSDIISRPSISPAPATRNNMQKFASTRLQKEINKQNEIEKKYRAEGKIISTSEEHVGLVKYTEIAQEDYSTSKRNFSINRKSSEPVKEQNGTAEPKSAVSPKVTPSETSAPKMSRSISGGVTFSYRESRHKAESKIEQELREMREREEELRYVIILFSRIVFELLEILKIPVFSRFFYFLVLSL